MSRTLHRKFVTVMLLLAWSFVSPAGMASEIDLSANQMDSFLGNLIALNTKQKKSGIEYGVCIDLHKRYDFAVLYEKYKAVGGEATKEQFNKGLEGFCIPENFVAPKTYVDISYGVNKLLNYTDANTLNTFRLAEVYLDRALPFSGTFFEGAISVSDRESETSPSESRVLRGAAFGRIAFAPEAILNGLSVNKQYRPSHKGKGTRLVVGLNVGKSDTSAYGFDIEAGYRKTNSSRPFAFDVLGRARWWLYDDSEQNAVYSAAITVKYPPTPFLGWQLDVGIGYQDNRVTDAKSFGLGGGFEFHRLKPLVVRLGADRNKSFGDDSDPDEYDTRISLSLIYKFPALRFTPPTSDTTADHQDSQWINQIWSVAASGSGGRVFTIDELKP